MKPLQPSMKGKSYKSVSKKLQFFVKNDACTNKQIQETMKESKAVNNKNTRAYIQAVVKLMFTQIHAKKVINIFGERDILEMIN